MDGGVEAIEDEAVREGLRRQARGVWGRTLVVAILGTALVTWLPL